MSKLCMFPEGVQKISPIFQPGEGVSIVFWKSLLFCEKRHTLASNQPLVFFSGRPRDFNPFCPGVCLSFFLRGKGGYKVRFVGRSRGGSKVNFPCKICSMGICLLRLVSCRITGAFSGRRALDILKMAAPLRGRRQGRVESHVRWVRPKPGRVGGSPYDIFTEKKNFYKSNACVG